MPDEVIGAVRLDRATLDAIEYLKNDGETEMDVFKRGFKILYALQTKLDEGYTQVFLRNPKEQKVLRFRITREVPTNEEA